MLINSHVNKKLIRVCCLIKTLFDDKNKPLNISREYHELHVLLYISIVKLSITHLSYQSN